MPYFYFTTKAFISDVNLSSFFQVRSYEFKTLGNGGDKITRNKVFAVLFALSIVAGIVPVSFADNNQEKTNFKLNESDTHVKVDKVVEVNAAYKYKKYKKYKSYKKSSYYKYKKYSYKKKSSSGYHYSKIGDCWAMSNYLYKKLTKKGTKSRIVQYKTSMSSRHRSVQLYKSGKWVDYNYKAHGINKIYNATSSKPCMKVIATSKV